VRRLADAGGWVGIGLMVLGVVLPFVRPDWGRFKWGLVIAGGALVLLGLLARVDDLRTRLGGRTVRYGANAAVMVVLALGVVVLVATLSQAHSWRYDLTTNKRFSLSPQTVQLLRGLTADVVAVAFFQSEQPNRRTAEDLLKRYAEASNGKFTWRMVDPDRDPNQARRYAIDAYGTVVLEAKERSEKIADAEEEKLTNGLVKLTREGRRVVYVVQGHGEHDLASTERGGFSDARAHMERANYEVKPLALAREGKVPDDAAVVVLAGPRGDLLPPELAALDAYLGRGGKALVMINPFQAEALRKHLVAWGIDVGNNLVVEANPLGQLFGIGPEVPIVQDFTAHPITRDLKGLTTLFPLTRTVTPAATPPAGTAVQPLAQTSAQSWGETDRAALERGQAKADADDPKGPLSVAAVATRDKARLVVFGTSTLAANQFINVQANRDLFLNAVSWLAEEEDQIAIRPRDTRQTPVFLNAQQENGVRLLTLLVMPGLAAVAGVVAVIRRRAAK
jgi:ABC-type uncharacterized transport system involved in gliding motility auxiliary subunit